MRLDAGPLSRDEAADLQAWLDADDSHESLLEEVQAFTFAAGGAAAELAAEGRLEVPAANAPLSAWWSSWRGLGTLAGVAAAAIAVVLIVVQPTPERFATAAAEQREVALADGTAVELNGATAIEVLITDRRRSIALVSGEAFFEVASDPARPFVVRTEAGEVRVTGTVFNVRRDSLQQFTVTVTEGSVDVQPRGGEVAALVVGDEIAVAADGIERRRLSARELANALAWREGRLVFESVTLAEAVARFAQFHDVEIEVDDSAAELNLGGRFELSDLDGFLRDIETALPVVVLRAPGVPTRIAAN